VHFLARIADIFEILPDLRLVVVAVIVEAAMMPAIEPGVAPVVVAIVTPIMFPIVPAAALPMVLLVALIDVFLAFGFTPLAAMIAVGGIRDRG
jgi:hypothetical protein